MNHLDLDIGVILWFCCSLAVALGNLAVEVLNARHGCDLWYIDTTYKPLDYMVAVVFSPAVVGAVVGIAAIKIAQFMGRINIWDVESKARR